MRVRTAVAVCLGVVSVPVCVRGQPDDRGSRVTLVDQRDSIAGNEQGHALVEIVNAGSSVWKADGRVRLSYQWLDANGRVVEHDARETVLVRDVTPGSTLRVCAALVAPAVPGRYAIRWDLLEDGVRWLSVEGRLTPAFQVVDVTEPLPLEPARAGPVVAWLLLTLLHVAAAVWLAWRWSGHARSDGFEEPLFTAMLFAVGGLAAVLAIVASTVGLSLVKASVALGLADAAALVAARVTMGSWSGRAARRPTAYDPFERVAEWAGAVVMTAVAVHWVGAAAAVFRVTGVDADHYHVPHAVNFALGASPFGLLATPHLYPAGTSLLAAWFLLPFDDPLIVDLAVLPAFLLVFASVAWIFRVATGRSGVAWTPWFVLLLFSSRLWRMSSLMSADLAYAAAFVALFAQLFVIRVRGVIGPLDVARAAIACGLLLGSKVTGASSAALLLALFAASLVVWPVSLGETARSWKRRIGLVVVAAVVATLTGGFWLARNWINYGSPVAPMGVRLLGHEVFPGPGVADPRFEQSSARGDLRDRREAAVTVLGASSKRWLGPLFLASLVGLLIVPLESAAGRWRRRRHARPSPAIRALWGGVVAASALVVWWTASLPWTSLISTEGMSLRFVLPVLALLPLVSLVSCFSPLLPWHAGTTSRNLVLAAFIVCSLGLFLYLQATAWSTDAEGRPGLSVLALGLSAALCGATAAASTLGGGRVAAVVGVAIMLALVAAGATMLAGRDRAARTAERAELGRLDACFQEGFDTDADQPRRVLLAVRAAESSRGTSCARRRFFVGTRLDDPLALLATPYTDLLFDVRRPGADFFDGGEAMIRGAQFVESAFAEARPGAWPGPCDYVVVDPRAPDGRPSSRVLAGLRQEGRTQLVGEVGDYLVFGVGR